eukprot:g2173.t1
MSKHIQEVKRLEDESKARNIQLQGQIEKIQALQARFGDIAGAVAAGGQVEMNEQGGNDTEDHIERKRAWSFQNVKLRKVETLRSCAADDDSTHLTEGQRKLREMRKRREDKAAEEERARDEAAKNAEREKLERQQRDAEKALAEQVQLRKETKKEIDDLRKKDTGAKEQAVEYFNRQLQQKMEAKRSKDEWQKRCSRMQDLERQICALRCQERKDEELKELETKAVDTQKAHEDAKATAETCKVEAQKQVRKAKAAANLANHHKERLRLAWKGKGTDDATIFTEFRTPAGDTLNLRRDADKQQFIDCVREKMAAELSILPVQIHIDSKSIQPGSVNFELEILALWVAKQTPEFKLAVEAGSATDPVQEACVSAARKAELELQAADDKATSDAAKEQFVNLIERALETVNERIEDVAADLDDDCIRGIIEDLVSAGMPTHSYPAEKWQRAKDIIVQEVVNIVLAKTDRPSAKVSLFEEKMSDVFNIDAVASTSESNAAREERIKCKKQEKSQDASKKMHDWEKQVQELNKQMQEMQKQWQKEKQEMERKIRDKIEAVRQELQAQMAKFDRDWRKKVSGLATKAEVDTKLELQRSLSHISEKLPVPYLITKRTCLGRIVYALHYRCMCEGCSVDDGQCHCLKGGKCSGKCIHKPWKGTDKIELRAGDRGDEHYGHIVEIRKLKKWAKLSISCVKLGFAVVGAMTRGDLESAYHAAQDTVSAVTAIDKVNEFTLGAADAVDVAQDMNKGVEDVAEVAEGATEVAEDVKVNAEDLKNHPLLTQDEQEELFEEVKNANSVKKGDKKKFTDKFKYDRVRGCWVDKRIDTEGHRDAQEAALKARLKEEEERAQAIQDHAEEKEKEQMSKHIQEVKRLEDESKARNIQLQGQIEKIQALQTEKDEADAALKAAREKERIAEQEEREKQRRHSLQKHREQRAHSMEKHREQRAHEERMMQQEIELMKLKLQLQEGKSTQDETTTKAGEGERELLEAKDAQDEIATKAGEGERELLEAKKAKDKARADIEEQEKDNAAAEEKMQADKLREDIQRVDDAFSQMLEKQKSLDGVQDDEKELADLRQKIKELETREEVRRARSGTALAQLSERIAMLKSQLQRAEQRAKSANVFDSMAKQNVINAKKEVDAAESEFALEERSAKKALADFETERRRLTKDVNKKEADIDQMLQAVSDRHIEEQQTAKTKTANAEKQREEEREAGRAALEAKKQAEEDVLKQSQQKITAWAQKLIDKTFKPSCGGDWASNVHSSVRHTVYVEKRKATAGSITHPEQEKPKGIED